MVRMEQPHRWLTPFLLWLLTLILWLPGLGNLPLRDWDEGLVANVARSTTGLLPMKWKHSYLNKPPGLHWPMGQLIRTQGKQENVVRLLPALISSLAIPLIFLLRRTLGAKGCERSALLSGLVLMTLLPMARHGRLAMLDGTLVSCTLLLWWGWVNSQTNHGQAFAAGLACSGILLLKPPAILGFGLIVLVASGRTLRPTGRRLCALVLGLLPGVSWHVWHWIVRGDKALLMWGGQGLARITTKVGDGFGWWIPWVEILEGGWPWLLLFPSGISWIWTHRQQTVGRWQLSLLLGSALMVLPLRTQLPWYSHLLWPPISLVCAEGLRELLERGQPRWVPQSWRAIGCLLTILGCVAIFDKTLTIPNLSLVCAGLGLLAGGHGLQNNARRHRAQGLVILLIGWGLALLTLWQSRLWLWELNESWDPRPIAAEIKKLPVNAEVLVEGPIRPSLSWYADRELSRFYQKSSPDDRHWVVSNRHIPDCHLANRPVKGEWQLWQCD
ncbi:glycosyltransferase family 39 protein [Synechococcus sp. M16CYN]|uniref:ArnT family glycosyltransferase n=1 Tax=Synechococcus sp. M16CYN TaxID=3103139 RepID=UPI0032509DD0